MDKQSALVYVRQLEVDRFVRKLAQSAGTPDSARINYHYDWMDGNTHVVVRCTSGAGTNSASVRINGGAVLYEAMDYGREVITYRHGQWVHRLRELADTEYTAAEWRRLEAESARRAAEAANFAPIDF